MKAKKFRRIVSLALAVVLALGLCAGASAADSRVQTCAEETAAFLAESTAQPQPGQAGGEWLVIGLARSGLEGSNAYFSSYADAAEKYVADCGGVLSARRYTEYSRMILALTALGRSCTDVGGYNLLTPLGDFEKTVLQGINGAAFALLALDCGGYAMPENSQAAVQATREMYLSYMLSRQHADGSFGLTDRSDPDVTSMVLTALAPYQGQPEVAAAVRSAVEYLSAAQDDDGGFSSWGTANTESTAQAVIALCALNIPVTDARFVKSGGTLVDALLRTYTPGKGFAHLADDGEDRIATEQAMLALAALLRFEKGSTSLFDMRDVPAGLSGKNADVHAMLVTLPGCDFFDTAAHPSGTAIRALAEREIVDGYDDGSFLPGKSMSRAEFAAIVVRALGLTPKTGGPFKDVPANQWYAPYIGTAYAYGIVDGVADDRFNPAGTITRQEAAIMVSRAARLCGLDTSVSAEDAAQILAQYPDGAQVSDWAAVYAAWCCRSGIFDSSMTQLRPKDQTLRGEMAQMLFNMLGSAELL